MRGKEHVKEREDVSRGMRRRAGEEMEGGKRNRENESKEKGRPQSFIETKFIMRLFK